MGVIYIAGKISGAIHCMHAPMQHIQNALTYFATAVKLTHKMFIKLTPVVNDKSYTTKIDISGSPLRCGQWHTDVMGVIYNAGKISCAIHCIQARMQHIQNALTYFDTAEKLTCKMLIKLTPVVHVKPYTTKIDKSGSPLRCGQWHKHFMGVI
jgi:hypothetical protein